MASGLTGSVRLASANHAANSRNGSSASVKSPPVNHAGCSIGAASDILGVPKCSRGAIGKLRRRSLYNGTAALRLCRRLHAASSARCGRAERAWPSAAAPTGCLRCSPRTTATRSRPARSRRPAEPGRASRRSPPRPAESRPRLCARGRRRTCSRTAARTPACPGKIRKPAPAATSRRLPPSYSEGGLPCRDFLASYVHGGSQDWLQGAACRTASGSWEVKRLKPLKPG